MDQVSQFVKELEAGKKAMFFLQGSGGFYVDLGERTLTSAEDEKGRYADKPGLELRAKGGNGIGAVTI